MGRSLSGQPEFTLSRVGLGAVLVGSYTVLKEDGTLFFTEASTAVWPTLPDHPDGTTGFDQLKADLDELGMGERFFYPLWWFLVRYITPIAVILVFLYALRDIQVIRNILNAIGIT